MNGSHEGDGENGSEDSVGSGEVGGLGEGGSEGGDESGDEEW